MGRKSVEEWLMGMNELRKWRWDEGGVEVVSCSGERLGGLVEYFLR